VGPPTLRPPALGCRSETPARSDPAFSGSCLARRDGLPRCCGRQIGVYGDQTSQFGTAGLVSLVTRAQWAFVRFESSGLNRQNTTSHGL
jgi:hypothetical protein